MSEELVYFNGKPVENPHESHNHVAPMYLYVGVFIALVFLTILTYGVSFANLGPMSLLVAMVVATVKASLVIAFFMHLLFEDRFYAFAFATAFLGIAIFFGFVLFDISAAGDLNTDADLGMPRIEADVAATENQIDPQPLPPPSREHLFQ
jgi:cytochrome c oxidase subunit 4